MNFPETNLDRVGKVGDILQPRQENRGQLVVRNSGNREITHIPSSTENQAVAPYTGKSSSNDTPLSSYNLEILNGIATNLLGRIDINQGMVKEDSSWGGYIWGGIKSYMPGSKEIGSKSGEVLALTHGSEYTNAVIEWLSNKWFAEPAVQKGIWEKFYDFAVKRPAAAGTTEAVKFAANYWVVPLLPAAASVAGAWAVPALVAACYYLASGSKDGVEEFKAQLEKLDPNDLISSIDAVNKGAKNLTNERGEILGIKDLHQMGKMMMRLHIISEIWKSGTRENAADVIENFYIQRLDGQMFYLDGAKWTEKERKAIKNAFDTLTDPDNLNSTKKHVKEIKAAIKKLANHSFGVNANGNESALIKCSDGKYCLANGRIVANNEDELNSYLKEKARELDGIIGDFAEMDVSDITAIMNEFGELGEVPDATKVPAGEKEYDPATEKGKEKVLNQYDVQGDAEGEATPSLDAID